MRTRAARLLLAATVAIVVMASTITAAPAQVLPEPPPVPPTPEELEPLLELLAVPGGALTEPGCAVLGTLLGLGVVVVPGLPGTIEGELGIPLPPELGTELLTATKYLLYVQGAGCGLLPLAAARTVCSVDEQLLAPLASLGDIEIPTDVPVNPLDLLPEPVAPAGVLVDTFRLLAAHGVPGAAHVVSALEEEGDCELRDRSGDVPPPPSLPDEPASDDPATPSPNSADGADAPAATPPGPRTPTSPTTVTGNAPLPETRGPLEQAAVPVVTTSILDEAPGWLLALIALALLWLVQTALRPRDDRLA